MTGRSVRRRTIARAIAALVLLVACGETLGPLSAARAPDRLIAQAVAMNAVRLSWPPVADPNVSTYVVERRTNHDGAFAAVGAPVSQVASQIVYIDTDVDPDTYYGYRVVAVTRFGDQSPPSITVGTRTPSRPAISVTTQSAGPTPDALDPDGYRVSITGPDTASAPIGLSAERRFGPLRAGPYQVSLRGVLDRCEVPNDSTRSVTVVDTGVHTVTPVQFNITCRDPTRGRIVATVTATGDSLDADGFLIRLTGVADDATLPEAERVITRQAQIAATGATTRFDDLRPGDYELDLDGAGEHCAIEGTRKRTVNDLVALSTITVSYAVRCESQREDDTSRPIAWRNVWSAASATNGQRVSLAIALDLRGLPEQDVGALQADLAYDASVLRYESFVPGDIPQAVTNGATPGLFVLGEFVTGSGIKGLVSLGTVTFTVIGASGKSAFTRTSLTTVTNIATEELKDLIRVVEDTISVGSGTGGGGGGTQNQPPLADANGPYTAIVGAAVTFSSSGSSDPEGSPLTYAWSFGDNTTGSGASPSHTYATAGTYTATLTVMDGGGATGTDQATVTVSAGGSGPNQPPVAEANGPYAGRAGAPVTFSATGSHDPDPGGTIASYQWTFSDGGSATGATVTHTFATAGNYTATLRVTDNAGAFGTDQAQVTITAPSASGIPLVLSAGAIDPVTKVVAVTIFLDLSNDIAETPGPEQLQSFIVQSIEWDRTVMTFFAFNFGQGWAGSASPDPNNAGKYSFASGLPRPDTNSSGLITLATIRFKLVGAPGRSTTTKTTPGAILSTAATGSFNYTPLITVQETTITSP